jgi:putative endonuclease
VSPRRAHRPPTPPARQRRGQASLPARRTSRQRLGDEGEALAARFLEAQGFRVVARNHRTRRGEVDLIAERGELLVFAEVRTRSSEAFGAPEETVDARKQARVVAAARDYLARRQGPERALRFDVLAVVGAEVRHLPGAFDAAGW